jgi:hypothetical protein
MLTNVDKVQAALPHDIKGWLGTGIDLFQCEPFEPPSTKPASLLSSSFQDFRRVESMPAIKYKEIYADSLLDMSQKLTVEAGLKGSYGGVSGSVDSKFSLSEGGPKRGIFYKFSFLLLIGPILSLKARKDLNSCLIPNLKMRSRPGIWMTYSRPMAPISL